MTYEPSVISTARFPLGAVVKHVLLHAQVISEHITSLYEALLQES